MTSVSIRGGYVFARIDGSQQPGTQMDRRFLGEAVSAMASLTQVLGGPQSGGNTLRLRVYLARKHLFPLFERARMEAHGRTTPPSSALGVGFWPQRGLVQLDVIGRVQGGGDEIEEIDERGVSEIAFFGKGRRCGEAVFLPGLIPVTPDGHIVTTFDEVPEAAKRFRTGRSHTDYRQETIISQSWYCWSELLQICAAIGVGVEVAHVTVFLRRPEDAYFYDQVEQVFLGKNGNLARSLVFVDEVGHRDCRIELEATLAVTPEDREFFPQAGDHDVVHHGQHRAVRVGNLTMLSGVTAELRSRSDGYQDPGLEVTACLSCETMHGLLLETDEALRVSRCARDDVGLIRLHLTEEVAAGCVLQALEAQGWAGKQAPAVIVSRAPASIVGVQPTISVEMIAVASEEKQRREHKGDEPTQG